MWSFADAVGHSPPLPSFAAGYWHSKNRYQSSEQLLDAARGFRSRGINVSVIVVDFHHWVHMGDFAFDSRNWSEPAAMVQELRQMGVAEVMVSAWPFLANNSLGLATALERGWVMTVQNTSTPIWWDDNNCAMLPPGRDGGRGHPFPPWAKAVPQSCVLYDPTQAAAREYIWSLMRAGYYQHGATRSRSHCAFRLAKLDGIAISMMLQALRCSGSTRRSRRSRLARRKQRRMATTHRSGRVRPQA